MHPTYFNIFEIFETVCLCVGGVRLTGITSRAYLARCDKLGMPAMVPQLKGVI